MKRVFIETPGFSSMVASEGISDAQVNELQQEIMAGMGVTIPGTGGMKKIRWAAAGGGKSGGRRVLFAEYERYGLIVLLAAYAKNVKSNLTQSEANEWKRLKHRLDAIVRQKYEDSKE